MKKKIIGVIVLVVIIGTLGFNFMNRRAVIQVSTTKVIEGSIEKYVEELGVVKTDNNSSIYSFVSGKVTDVYVKVGDEVKTGDVIARVDRQQQERQLIVLDAQRDFLDAQYKEALKPIDENEIKRMELLIEDAQRRLEETKTNADNAEKLRTTGAISNQEYQSIVLRYETEKTNLRRMELELDQLMKPISQNVVQQFEAQLNQIDAQREELKSSSMDFTINAPIDGFIMTKNIEVGNFLQPGIHIMEIGNISELYVESDILVDDISNIKEGALVKISNNSLNLNNATGIVRKIHPQAFSKISDLGIEQKRIKVEIDFNDSITNLRPGYDLDIKIVIEKEDKALIVPESAVFQMNGVDYVFVNQDGIALMKEIEKGIEGQRLVEVKRGLSQNDIVILSPKDNIKEGAHIKAYQEDLHN